MSTALKGLQVLVTRPAAQSGALAGAIEAAGGFVRSFPALAILLFCALVGVFAGLAGAAFGGLRRGRAVPDAALFAACWLIFEW
ncbi:MAG TPA: hypothetical protein PLY77_14340, partial [Plasticicumulans sp.]|nr:hypothetical protein [Plasticicumulans sp.]